MCRCFVPQSNYFPIHLDYNQAHKFIYLFHCIFLTLAGIKEIGIIVWRSIKESMKGSLRNKKTTSLKLILDQKLQSMVVSHQCLPLFER